jgi:hypothetical protein
LDAHYWMKRPSHTYPAWSFVESYWKIGKEVTLTTRGQGWGWKVMVL